MEDWHHYIPFAALWMETPPEVTNRPLATRLIEQGTVGVVTAICTSVIILYAVSQVQGEKLEALSRQQIEAKAAEAADIREIKEMVIAMQRDLYVPRSRK